MNPTRRSRSKARPCAEVLESRSLLTGGAGDTFAILPATIAQAGGTAAVKFTVDPSQFVRPHGKLTLGIDVAAATGSTAQPQIVAVLGPDGTPVHGLTRSAYDSHVKLQPGESRKATRAVLIPMNVDPRQKAHAETFTLEVSGQNKTSGAFLAGFYLPGDANGDGVVDQTDLKSISGLKGARAGDNRYSFEADSNRDGRIDANDLAIARGNLGDKVTVLPVVSSNLDPATDSGAQDRITSVNPVRFTGQVTPAAKVTYAQAAGQVPAVTTTADASGNYAVVVPLAAGANTFQVTTSDTFGQSISGKISPVTFARS